MHAPLHWLSTNGSLSSRVCHSVTICRSKGPHSQYPRCPVLRSIAEFPKAQGCMLPMGVTSENVAAQFNVSRKTQDTFAVRSHKKAAAARAAGKFKDEIVPVHTKVGRRALRME